MLPRWWLPSHREAAGTHHSWWSHLSTSTTRDIYSILVVCRFCWSCCRSEVWSSLMKRGCWCWLRRLNCVLSYCALLSSPIFISDIKFYNSYWNPPVLLSHCFSATKYVNFFMRRSISMTGSLTVTWETPSERSHTSHLSKLSLLEITFVFMPMLVQHQKSCVISTKKNLNHNVSMSLWTFFLMVVTVTCVF